MIILWFDCIYYLNGHKVFSLFFLGLTYSVIRKFRKSPVASMHGSLQLKGHRLVYPSYRIQQKQMVDVIKHRNSFFQNADGARRSSVSSSKSNYSVLFHNNIIVLL